MKKYSVTKTGDVINEHGKVLRLNLNKKGYLSVCLCFDGIKSTYLVHRLVSQTHIPNQFNLPMVNHKNGIKTDNRVENLEWCSAQHNTDHARKTGLIKDVGEDNPMAKLTEQQVREIRAKYVPRKYPTRKLSKEYNISQSVVMDVIHRRIWTHI